MGEICSAVFVQREIRDYKTTHPQTRADVGYGAQLRDASGDQTDIAA